jgi:hypothetical protein
MKNAAAWIEQYRAFWETQFDALAKYLESSAKKQEDLQWPRYSKSPSTRSKSAARSRRPAKKSLPRGPGANS